MKKAVLVLLPLLLWSCSSQVSEPAPVKTPNMEDILADIYNSDEAEINTFINLHDAKNCPDLTGKFNIAVTELIKNSDGKEIKSESIKEGHMQSTVVENGVQISVVSKDENTADKKSIPLIADGKRHANENLTVIGVCNQNKEVAFLVTIKNYILDKVKFYLTQEGDLVEKRECPQFDSQVCPQAYERTTQRN